MFAVYMNQSGQVAALVPWYAIGVALWLVGLFGIGMGIRLENLWRGLKARAVVRRRFEQRFGRSDLKFLRPTITFFALFALLFGSIEDACLARVNYTHTFTAGDFWLNLILIVLVLLAFWELSQVRVRIVRKEE